MGYVVKVQTKEKPTLSRKYGTGREGKSGSYRTRDGADVRAKLLNKKYPKRLYNVTIVRVLD